MNIHRKIKLLKFQKMLLTVNFNRSKITLMKRSTVKR
jgi:hypothetical protein